MISACTSIYANDNQAIFCDLQGQMAVMYLEPQRF